MKTLFVASGKSRIAIRTDDIAFCEADGRYSRIVSARKQEYLVSKHLGELELLLPCHNFCRTHRKFIINIHFLKEIETNGASVILMNNGAQIPISFRKRKKVLDSITLFYHT